MRMNGVILSRRPVHCNCKKLSPRSHQMDTLRGHVLKNPSTSLSTLRGLPLHFTTALIESSAADFVHPSTRAPSCKRCGVVSFPRGFEEQRAHFQSDWHLFNLESNEPSLTLEQFESLEIASGTSSSSSEESLESGSGRDGFFLEGGEDDFSSLQGPTRVFDDDGTQRLSLRVYASVARDAQELDGVIAEMQTWGVFVYRSGHFACGLFVDGELKQSKAEHRYTQRKKQGGSQAAHDSKGHKAKSAGAQLRRYGEQTMRERVAVILLEFDWKSCTRVFLSVPERARNLFVVADKQVEKRDGRFLKSDTRVRRVPFATQRPTIDEVKRIMKMLWYVDVFATPERVVLEPVLLTMPREVQTVSAAEPIPEKTEKEKRLELGFYRREIHAAVANDDIDTIRKFEDDVESRDENGDTPLHLACEANAVNAVRTLLELKADPTSKDLIGRVPYQRAKQTQARNEMRVFRGENPDAWDWNIANVPEPPKPRSEEEERASKEKEKEKKKRQAERKKNEKAAEIQAESIRIEQAAAALKALSGKPCDQCRNPLPKTRKERFTRSENEFCSSSCMREFVRNVTLNAVEKRWGGA